MPTRITGIVVSAAVAGLCCHSTTAFSRLLVVGSNSRSSIQASSSSAWPTTTIATLLPKSATRNRFRSTTTTRLLVSIPGTVEDQEDVLPVNSTNAENISDKNILETTVEESVEPLLETAIPFIPTTPHSLLSKRQRFSSALPRIFLGKANDALDTSILKMAIPNMINLGVVPIVNSVDTFWVGRLGIALALAGQAAANQASFTLFFLIAFLPTITAPLVASAVASGNQKEAQQRVCESLFLSQVLGFVGTAALVCFPRQILSALVLPAGAPAMEYAAPYLRWRALGMVPALISATGFAAYRGMLNTVTPLKVSLMTQAFNLIMDPVCMFQGGMGFVGAAIATAAAETLGGLTYLRLLFRNKLATWSGILRPPKWSSLLPLLQGGAAMLARQLALNIGFLAATRRAQIMDPSGVSGAAYGIVMQIYSVGVILLVAMQATAAALIPASLAKSGNDGARQCADRLFAWSSVVGSFLGMAQFVLLPKLVPIFSTLPQVQQAVRLPALIASIIHVVNGPVFAGEGYMLGMGQYKDLALITAFGISAMVGCLASPLGKQLDGIMWSILISSVLQSMGVVLHFLKVGPLARSREQAKVATA